MSSYIYGIETKFYFLVKDKDMTSETDFFLTLNP